MLRSSGALMAMRRGFFSSGTRRSSSTWSRPFSSRAVFTSTCSGKLEALRFEGAARDALVQEGRLFGNLFPFLPLTVRTRSFTSTDRSFSAKPATATVTR